ncbi:ABC transporter substrate-binding protein [Azomonas macrocytogenes]|uniref:Iron complex transport system substrate-binding protein n=1 Tax=Azomonas macrocytogenes TaxID=69962 RepID=A0A839T521_AZOMA|nr:ABC transporter substrate-binding protein [Azomonas macrocytogenes]MBB3104542.1 iron complex transport system substrate-binding protein [Azomonas macrocytogenes]
MSCRIVSTSTLLATLAIVEILFGSHASASSRTVIDQTGHLLHLPQQVRSVGTPGISMASLILVLTEGQKLTAVAPEVRDNPWLRRVMPSAATLATPFSRPSGVNLESLLAIKPDLVTLWLGNAVLGKQLEALGIPVFNLGYTTPEEMKNAVRLLGTALGDNEKRRAEDFIRYYDDNLQRVAQGLTGLPPDTRPRVYYASISPLHTEGLGSMIDSWIDTAGGINVAAASGLRGDVQVQMEQVIAWNPDIIVTLDATQQQAILQSPRWKHIKAVRNGQVLLNPRGINAWCTRAAETSLQILWAARTLHPQRFPALDMAEETRIFYRRFYRYTPSDDELALILRGASPENLPSGSQP